MCRISECVGQKWTSEGPRCAPYCHFLVSLSRVSQNTYYMINATLRNARNSRNKQTTKLKFPENVTILDEKPDANVNRTSFHSPTQLHTAQCTPTLCVVHLWHLCSTNKIHKQMSERTNISRHIFFTIGSSR